MSWKQQCTISRRGLLKAGLACMGAGAGVVGYTLKIEPHWLELVSRPLPLPGLPDHWRGATLAQLSDLHIGPRVDDHYLLKVFKRIRELQPDLVVYTGDFTSHEPELLAHAERLFTFLPRGTRGTYGVLGNHDYGINWSQPQVAREVAALAEQAGVQVLRNQGVDLQGLHIVGLDDLWGHAFDLDKGLKGLSPDRPAIALSHNPDTADQPGWENLSGWILAGHTHGGQCKPPFLQAPLLPVNNKAYSSGAFTLDRRRRMYISRGVGHLIQARFNVRPEVTLFTLVDAA